MNILMSNILGTYNNEFQLNFLGAIYDNRYTSI